MTKHVNLRLPDDVHALAVAAAEADDRSLNSWLIAVVRRAVSDETPFRPLDETVSRAQFRGNSDSPPA